jgi:putative ABC transport system substrate-binding protein
MQRRSFLSLLGTAAAAWPLAARAQQRSIPEIGCLARSSAAASQSEVAAFRKGLSETGFVEGRNVTIEYRWANSEAQRLPELAGDLVRRRVSVIATAGASATSVVKTLTTTIPIVFTTVADPVQSGLVASLNRPGGNVTGVSMMSHELEPKQLGIFHDLLPRARHFGLLTEAVGRGGVRLQEIASMKAAASQIGCEIDVLLASDSREIDAAFATLLENKIEGLIVSPTVLFSIRRSQILTLAARHAVPTMHSFRETALAGGLISYGPIATEQIRQSGIYTGRVLKSPSGEFCLMSRALRFDAS